MLESSPAPGEAYAPISETAIELWLEHAHQHDFTAASSDNHKQPECQPSAGECNTGCRLAPPALASRPRADNFIQWVYSVTVAHCIVYSVTVAHCTASAAIAVLKEFLHVASSVGPSGPI